MQHKSGRDIYSWKSMEPHDYLDCMSMSYAVAASQGINGSNVVSVASAQNRKARKPGKHKVKLV